MRVFERSASQCFPREREVAVKSRGRGISLRRIVKAQNQHKAAPCGRFLYDFDLDFRRNERDKSVLKKQLYCFFSLNNKMIYRIVL